MLELIQKANFYGWFFFFCAFLFPPCKELRIKKKKKKKQKTQVGTLDQEKWSEGEKEPAYLWQKLLICCSNENLEVNGEGTSLERKNKKKAATKKTAA